ncbi:transglutaminase [Arcobacter sp. CECT 8986]|uniref:transglutaminase-like domain-containing protein n=1 Tax=Arcobacter sp. CECT 8986 TaxID=2044507 RepID=UPI001009FECC|nr:transglutaminase-like domain-containing protein [Arcobacter sp. CECT 8986]RXK00552.1 transglutaminase [Arcobacter sp. CECT 8986]
MQRRSFLKTAAVVGTTMAITPSIVLSDTKTNAFGITKKPRKFSVTNTFDLETNDQVAKLWVPLPLDSSYQKVLKVSYDGDFDEAFISNNNAYDTKLLFAKWNKNSKSRKLVVKFDIIMQERSVNFPKAKNSTIYPEDVKEFLKGTKHTPITKKLTSFANEITKDARTPLEKAQAIFDWTVDNMYRDESVIGCGVGDASRIIEKKLFGGKCTDVSSVFVALLRNAGIPAREVFGIRLGKSMISKSCGKADENGFAKITGGQHCRAEFYLVGLGWVPADPADVTKVRTQEKLTNDDKKIKDLRKYFFGNWEMNWAAFNYARDFVLNPKPAQYPLNMLGYPYGEMDDDVLNYYAPKEFKYSYTSQEVK